MENIFNQLKKSGFKIFGPALQDGETGILELVKAPEAELLSKISDRPYKYFFTPIRETLLNFKNKKISSPKSGQDKIALFGMSIFDCKAVELYDKVFKDDIYYQERRKNILIVGYSPAPLEKIKTPFFKVDLASVVFDVFIESLSASSQAEFANLKFYARSKKGEEILKKCGIKYKLVKYTPRKEDKKVLAIKTAVETSKNNKLWDELGEICLACGKCAIACPTCYCFDLESTIGPECRTERCSGNCFYDDFTRIAGGHKFLNNPKEKIFFWYYHKFVRIPHEYGLPGCTDCGRCTAVCPVGINIKKNIERLMKETKNSLQKSGS